MTKQTQTTTQQDPQDETQDVGTWSEDQERVIARLISGIGKRERAPYGGGRSYALLPEEME